MQKCIIARVLGGMEWKWGLRVILALTLARSSFRLPLRNPHEVQAKVHPSGSNSRASRCVPSETARTPCPRRSSRCYSSKFSCGKRRWRTLPKRENPRVVRCSGTFCSWCCHSAAQQGLMWPLHLPDTSFLQGERTTTLLSCKNPICWLGRPPLTFVKSTSLLSSAVLGGEKIKWHGWRSVLAMNAPVTSWRLGNGDLSLGF